MTAAVRFPPPEDRSPCVAFTLTLQEAQDLSRALTTRMFRLRHDDPEMARIEALKVRIGRAHASARSGEGRRDG